MTAAPAGLEASAPARPREPSFVLPLTILVGLITVSPAFLVLQRPALALFAFVVAVVVFLCALRADIALLLLVATAPLDGAIQMGSGSVLTISKLAGALAFSSFFLFALATKRKVLVDRSHAIIGLILALALLSTLQARDVPQGFSTTIRYASFVALYLVVSQFANDHRLQRRIVWVLCAASTVAGLLSIRNFLNETTTQAALPYTNANDTAFVLATTLPLAFWLLREPWVLRFAAIAMIGVMSASIVLSFSRGALVGLGAAALVQLLTQRKHILLLAVGVAVSAATTIAFIHTNPGQVESGFQAKQRVAEQNVESRVGVWRGALDLIEAKPLLGVGPGNFREYFYEVTGNPPGTPNVLVVHNAFLDVGAELGVAAMLLFIAYVVIVLRRATLATRAESGLPGYAMALRAALIVAVVASLFLSEQYYAPLWLLGGLATALWRESKAAAVPAAKVP